MKQEIKLTDSNPIEIKTCIEFITKYCKRVKKVNMINGHIGKLKHLCEHWSGIHIHRSSFLKASDELGFDYKDSKFSEITWPYNSVCLNMKVNADTEKRIYNNEIKQK